MKRAFRYIKFSCIGFFYYYFRARRTFIVIVSSYRSGSTLLKALLSEAPEIVHTNEKSLKPFGNKYATYYYNIKDSDSSIILFKRPGGFWNEKDYLNLPKNIQYKLILLIRHPVDTINSIMEMNTILKNDKTLDQSINMWSNIYSELLTIKNVPNTKCITYENLIKNPVDVTQELFDFVGSKRKIGTSKYSVPISGDWRWGEDDGGEKIRKLEVVNSRTKEYDRQFVDRVMNNKKVQQLIQSYDL